jgi:hypothetical protein
MVSLHPHLCSMSLLCCAAHACWLPPPRLGVVDVTCSLAQRSAVPCAGTLSHAMLCAVISMASALHLRLASPSCKCVLPRQQRLGVARVDVVRVTVHPHV